MNNRNFQRVIAFIIMVFLTYCCFEYESGWAGIGAALAFLVAIDG